ncbi:M50 family metallopeptidase [Sphingomonas crusticola]|uniref:M50 family metallopeptidase n=1 Tax=Sphingomonas crusticola TaxID=1697973 RepID=UPI000E26247F|nr:M50 family metallopeptidase [Sphingomonas crusticola]
MIPRLKPSVSFFPINDNLFHVYDSNTARHFKLGRQEVDWLRRFDGQASSDDLRKIVPMEYFDDFLGHLRRMQLIEGSEAPRKIDPLKIKTKLFNPDALLDRSLLFCKIYSAILFMATPFLVLANLAMIGMTWTRVNELNATMLFSPSHIAFFVACVIVSGMLHEMSHALVAKAHGVHVPVIGFMFMLFYPAFYADVSGINLLAKRDDRIRVLVAGILCNNAILFFALAILVISPSQTVASLAAIVIVANLMFALFNLIPFVEYDGYYILCEMLGDPKFAVTSRMAILTRRDVRLINILYFAVSNLFITAIIFLLVNAVRGFVLPWSGAWVANAGAVALFAVAMVLISQRMLRSSGVR